MLQIALIRHSITAGNLARQYIGSIDQPLCPEGVALAKAASAAAPQVERVFCSPMQRCRQTAALLYPGQEAAAVEGLRECDFGVCEGKTYEQLCEREDYRAWIASSGLLPPPGGEDPQEFRARCQEAFGRLVRQLEEEGTAQVALVVHGGVIMSLMHSLCRETRSFYEWQVKNCCGYRVEVTAEPLALTLLEPLVLTEVHG